ncbi:MAG: hypothetical protein QXK76_04190 [Candidatus Woesearchaeota archaeon]
MGFLLKTNKGIESIITKFSGNNSNITLYPMVHFGIKDFYQQILSQAVNHEIVLYEGVSMNSQSENFYSSMLEKNMQRKNMKEKNNNTSLNEIFFMTISLYQSTVSRIFGLSEQFMEQLKYMSLENFHNADICIESIEEYDIKDYVKKSKNYNNKKLNKKLSDNKILQNYIGNLLYRIDLLEFIDKFEKKSEKDMLKIYESIINETLSDSKITEKMVFSKQRESQLIDILEVVLENYNDIGIIYGADHMNAFSKYLKNKKYLNYLKMNILAIPKVPPKFSKK